MKKRGYFLLAGFWLLFALPAIAAARYPQFPDRSTQSLDGSWHFAWLGEADLVTLDPASAVFGEIAAVPGVFDTAVDVYGRRGTALYRRTVAAPAGGLRLKIGGLGLYAKIWWDQALIGEIKLPYASVDLDFVNAVGGEHVLTIAVDNRFSANTAPLFKPKYDFYAYGGIYRSVFLQTLPERRIERVRVITLDPQKGLVNIRLEVAGVPDGALKMNVAFDRTAPVRGERSVKNGVVEWESVIPEATMWSPETPVLHTITVEAAGERIVDRFGLRTVKAEGRQILLNGEAIRLKGVNRHESHPQFGPVQNTHLMVEDIRLAKALNANFIRCVHYQHDPEFYELCDEMGILVWAESLGWGLDEQAVLSLSPLLEEETRILGRVVANHPSVIIAGFLNECASDTESTRPVYRMLAGTLRETAPAQLVSYASNRLKKDLSYDVCDVVSVNYYPGWIGPTSWDKPASAQLKPYIDDLATWFSDPANVAVCNKPLLTSETGASGVYGVRDRAMAQWSEEFQANYFVTSIRASMTNPRFCGVTLWQFFDTRSFVNTGDVRSKFRGFNSAGLLDEYRRPKLAYDEVQKVFGELAP